MKILLKNARIIEPTKGIDTVADILIVNGIIEKIASRIHSGKSVQEFELDGQLVVPGFIDMHVHLREPGFEHNDRDWIGCCSFRRFYCGLLYAKYKSTHR
jgi:dihydroorotase